MNCLYILILIPCWSCCCCCCSVALVVSHSVRPQRRQPTRLPRPWDSPGKNTGVGCHFLIQCMKVKSEVKSLSRVRLLVTPWTAGPPGSSIHGILQARILEWGAIAFSACWSYHCKYFLQFSRVFFHFVRCFPCCAKLFRFN